MKKALVFDLDGTLAPVGEAMSGETLKKLRALEDEGYIIAVCSGKPCYYLCGMLRQSGLKSPWLLGENGAVLQLGVGLPPLRCLKVRVTEGQKRALAGLRELIDAACGDKIWYQPNEVMLTPFPREEGCFEVIQAVLDENQALCTELDIYRHADCFDIVPRGIDKGAGLRMLAESLGCKTRDFIAVGDGINDIPMFREAGISIMIGEGRGFEADLRFNKIESALDCVLCHRL